MQRQRYNGRWRGIGIPVSKAHFSMSQTLMRQTMSDCTLEMKGSNYNYGTKMANTPRDTKLVLERSGVAN